MSTNTAFSHSKEECSPYFLVITHQNQARDDIVGLMQERRNSIAYALKHVFLAPSHPYKECHLCPPLLLPSMQWNQYDNALSYFFKNYIIGQCTEPIASHYIVLRHIEITILRLSNSWYPTTSTTPNTYCSGSLEPEYSCHDRDWIMELSMEADILTFTGILTPEDASVASCFPFDITISLSWFPLLSIPPLHSAIP